jgi:hypothetical protein
MSDNPNPKQIKTDTHSIMICSASVYMTALIPPIRVYTVLMRPVRIMVNHSGNPKHTEVTIETA